MGSVDPEKVVVDRASDVLTAAWRSDVIGRESSGLEGTGGSRLLVRAVARRRQKRGSRGLDSTIWEGAFDPWQASVLPAPIEAHLDIHFDSSRQVSQQQCYDNEPRVRESRQSGLSHRRRQRKTAQCS